MDLLTSRTNPRLRHVAKLRQGRYRRQQGQFVVDGQREISRALASSFRLLELFVVADRYADLMADGSQAVDNARQADRLTLVGPDAFVKIAYGQRNEGMVGVFETPAETLLDSALPADGIVLVADSIEKPGNLGAILRSADAAGVDAVVCCDCGTDRFHPNVIRASLGALFGLKCGAYTAAEIQAWLARNRYRCFAARVDAPRDFWTADLTGAVALIVGAEATGLRANWQTEAVSIPMLGHVDSLNVSVAAALLAFESRRQKQC